MTVHRHPRKGDILRVQLCNDTGEPIAPVLVTTFDALERHGWVTGREETIHRPAGDGHPEYAEQAFWITVSGLDALNEERLR